jgi:hypothetical protein
LGTRGCCSAISALLLSRIGTIMPLEETVFTGVRGR